MTPKNFEKMKVAYARDIFKPEVVAALWCMKDMFQMGFENVVPLTNFLEFFGSGSIITMFATLSNIISRG